MVPPAALPAVDLAPLDGSAGSAARAALLDEIRRAVCDTGFLTVHGHGVGASCREGGFEAARAFFGLPEAARRRVSPRPWNPASPNRYRGYFPASVDGKEGFDVGDPLLVAAAPGMPRTPLLEANRLPEELGASWQRAVAAYFDALSELGARLFGAIVEALGGEPERTAGAFPRPGSASTLRFNRYPVCTSPHTVARDGTALCCASHVDNGVLTVLAQDARAGLQVRDRRGSWCDVPYEADAFVVNTGLAFRRLCGERLAATPHRVVQAREERLSIPFFFEPRPELPLDPGELGLPARRDPVAPETYQAFLARAMRRFPEYDRPGSKESAPAPEPAAR